MSNNMYNKDSDIFCVNIQFIEFFLKLEWFMRFLKI